MGFHGDGEDGDGDGNKKGNSRRPGSTVYVKVVLIPAAKIAMCPLIHVLLLLLLIHLTCLGFVTNLIVVRKLLLPTDFTLVVVVVVVDTARLLK